ncbi:hypothetical protein VHA01S_014_00990 [Vibrio halioticoli NBRC 102217]|uniref:diguanylate cyclase n=1 Tax=Vibrio halioticoli NBRC 102217 TaxID=1219072 RepID=V5F1T0_9VIBR|nr:GGDEF domain-containing protein [Vibrio halioticoli]GAD89074.1 hypothetical protein VHA01S_014_00990 [Vibrio halioticoli NBRC 102217]
MDKVTSTLSNLQLIQFQNFITTYNRKQLRIWLPIIALCLFSFGLVMPLWSPSSALLNSATDVQHFRDYLLFFGPLTCLLIWFYIPRLPVNNSFNILYLFLTTCILTIFHAALISHSYTLAPISVIMITALVKVTILKSREIAIIYGSSIVCGCAFVMWHQERTDILSVHLLISNLIIITWLLYLGKDHYSSQTLTFIHNQQQSKAKKQITLQLMELEAQKVQLKVLLGRDTLTGLYNRRYFDQQLIEEIQRATRAQSPLGLLVIDIDHFKMVNDTLGHQIGDKYLKKIAIALNQTCRREIDTVARFGGEEFVILLPNTDTKGLTLLCNRLLQAVAELNIPHPSQPKLSISIGGCQFDETTMNSAQFFENADQALYQVKTSGRNNFMIHTS